MSTTKENTENPKQIGISVLIRTFNSAATLRDVLEKLHLSSVDQLIIVDSGSSDTTLEIAKEFPAEILPVSPPFNYSRSLNIGIAATKCDWVFVLSSHCIPAEEDLLLQVRKTICAIESDIAMIYGRCPLIIPEKSAADLRYFDQTIWRETHISGSNAFAIYPKIRLQERLFDETLTTAEDLDWLLWALRKGYRGVKANHLIALYRNKGSISYMFQKGWKEVLTSRYLKQMRPSPSRVTGHIKSLLMTLAKIIKLSLISKIDRNSALNGGAHNLGAVCAGILSDLGLIDRFVPPNDSPHDSGT